MVQFRLRYATCLIPALSLLACGGGAPEAQEPAAAEPAATPDEAAPSPEPTTGEPGATEAAGEAPPAEGSSGRLAFIQCETPRPTACTREYRPVCAEVDTGIRCIKAPCPSSEKKTYATGCTACADEKVIGYFSAACDAIASGQTP